MIKWRKMTRAGLAVLLAMALAACGSNQTGGSSGNGAGGSAEPAAAAQEETTAVIQPVMIDSPEPMTLAPTAEEAAQADEGNADEASGEDAATGAEDDAAGAAEEVEKNGDVYILFTSDIHCGVDKGFGFAGLQQIRDTLEKQGYTTLLVDDGDAIQGEALGTLSTGEAMTDLMNVLHYDVAIPGNHEFDYGVDRFLELTKKAEFPYICCNFLKEGEQVFPSYIITEAAGIKIAFVGVVTPTTLTTSSPVHFQNAGGEFTCSFMQEDTTGEELYEAVQKAVDDARAEGADYVYVMGHMGLDALSSPWTYADVISHTNGIDVFLDGHSHDTEQIVMKNKDGQNVVRSACGTKLNCIGYSHISAAGGIKETNIWSWPNQVSLPELTDIHNDVSDAIDEFKAKTAETMNEVVAQSAVDLVIHDPVEKDASGNLIRMVRRSETNAGDFCADAFRKQLGTDIAVVNGGAIRVNMSRGDVTYGDIISVFPFSNQAAVIRATGQQILDALEWGASGIPDEFGGFLQVSGMSYEVNAGVPTPCVRDDHSMMASIEGKRRVSNVMVGEEPIDPKKTYTVGGVDFLLLERGDGNTAFEGAELVENMVKIDSQLLIDYITEDLGGEIGEEYADPYGLGRITIVDD